jgi:hypothetical protein
MPAPVTTEQQLAWEERLARPAAAVLFASVVLNVAAGIYLPAAIGRTGSSDLDRVIAIERHPGPFLMTAVLQTIATLLLVPAFLYLDRATKFRLPSRAVLAPVLVMVGPALAAVGAIGSTIDLNDLASHAGPLSEPGAKDLLRDDTSPVFRGIAQGGGVAVGFAFITISLNAMRAGLLSRFMGILGVVLGALSLLTALATGGSGGGFIQIFWLGAVGVLFLDRWPGGRGPAWDSGEAIPWPSAAEQRAEQERVRAEEAGVMGAEEGEEAAGAEEDETEWAGEGEDAPPAQRPHPVSKKRKRKRRR